MPCFGASPRACSLGVGCLLFARGENCLHLLFDSCVSSLRRGHANLLCTVPSLTDDPRRESSAACLFCRAGRQERGERGGGKFAPARLSPIPRVAHGPYHDVGIETAGSIPFRTQNNRCNFKIKYGKRICI